MKNHISRLFLLQAKIFFTQMMLNKYINKHKYIVINQKQIYQTRNIACKHSIQSFDTIILARSIPHIFIGFKGKMLRVSAWEMLDAQRPFLLLLYCLVMQMVISFSMVVPYIYIQYIKRNVYIIL